MRSEWTDDWDPRDLPCAQMREESYDICQKSFTDGQPLFNQFMNSSYCSNLADFTEAACHMMNALNREHDLANFNKCVIDGLKKAMLESEIANKESVSPEEVDKFEKYMDKRMSKVYMQCVQLWNINPSENDWPKDADPVVIDTNKAETDRPTETR